MSIWGAKDGLVFQKIN